MKLSDNTNFFKDPSSAQRVSPSSQAGSKAKISAQEAVQKKTMPYVGGVVVEQVKNTIELLTRCGFHKLAGRVESVLGDAAKERFVVAVVGEFNRGKSTFVNNLLDNEIDLPVGTLPTTAVLTKIRYAQKAQMAVFDDKDTRQNVLELSKASWEGLVANNFGEKQPRGSVIVGIPNKWLGQNKLELIDCPGAGDLSEERAQNIITALDRADAAIINLNANAALSRTEREFILQRILKRKTPFTMVVINKLDLVKKEERNSIVKYVKDILTLNNMKIPVYIPSDVEMTDDTYANIQGREVVRSVVARWAADPKRQVLTELWIKARVQDIVNIAIESLKEQQKIYVADNEESQRIIQTKIDELARLELYWGDLEVEMQKRSNSCCKNFLEKVEEYKENIIERLQYEARHSATPESWWKDDYPYRLKVELANLSVSLDNAITKEVARDVNWFNQVLNQRFKNIVQVGDATITQKQEFTESRSERKLEFEDLGTQQNIGRIVTAGLSIAGFFALGPASGLGILATMGIGTGGTIIQSVFFKKKLEEQRAQLTATIAKDIPTVVDKATANSEQRIQAIYDSVIKESSKKKELWIDAQKMAIEANNKPKSAETQKQVCDNISELETASVQLN